MAEGGFEMDDFDPAEWREEEEETDFSLPEPPTLQPLDGQILEEYGDRLSQLTDANKAGELQAQRDRLIDSFYREIERAYGLRPTKIEYEWFEIDRDGKTLYLKVGNKTIQISTSRGPVGFLGLQTIARNYGRGGTQAIRDYLNLPEYSSAVRRNNPELESLKEKADAVVKANDDDLDRFVNDIVENMPTPEMATASDTLPLRELRALDKALRTIRGEKAVQESKRVSLQHALEGFRKETERAKTTEEADHIEREIKKAEEQLEAVKDSIGTLNFELRSQVRQIRETLTRVLDKDVTLAERIRTLFREQGITIASILTAIGMTISTLVLALTGSRGAATPPTPPSDKGGAKEWVKKHLQSLGRVLGKLAGKAAAALPGIIGSMVSWILSLLSKTAGWLAENLWAVVVAVGSLLLVAARKWLA